MKKIVPILFSLVLFLMLPLSTFAASTLDEIKAIVKSDYVGEIDGDLQNAKTINEVIEMLDPYSAYYTAEEYNGFLNNVDMKSVGIGVVIEKHDKGILITDVIENGSAHQNGIVAGDIITKVNGISISNKTLEETQSLILGEENTRIILEILKKDGSVKEELLTRKTFSVPNATSKLLYGKVGYIYLSSFSQDAAKLVADEYKKLKNQGATSFILDLQFNGGGFVSSAEELIGMFPGAEDAFKEKTSNNTSTIRAAYQSEKFPENTRLLVNRFSASASEMTAAALLDQDAAIVYGEKTYGKGTMQGFYRLADDSYLKLTVAEFFGPKGTKIRNVGLTPDIVTTVNPIFQSHYEAIAANLANYKELKSLENVPTTKTFKVTFNKALATNVDSNAVELVELAGDKVDATVAVNDTQLTVTPKEKLINDGQYMLIIHPTVKDVNDQALKQGRYLKITVEKAEKQ